VILVTHPQALDVAAHLDLLRSLLPDQRQKGVTC
jgi:hypothetical protein